MTHEFGSFPSSSGDERVSLYPGIDLSYMDLVSDSLSLRHAPLAHIMQIHYCRAGQIEWSTQSGHHIFLNPGDYSVHTLNVCANSSLRFPAGRYQGLVISIDLRSARPPEWIAEAGVFDRLLREGSCQNRAVSFFAGDERSQSIFSAFYDQPESLKLPYQRIKVLELLLHLAKLDCVSENRLSEYPSKQVETVREIHDQLLQHMDQRITIEALSKQYLINPTTLKSAFKAVYGTSLAAHIKKHRMEQAAKMLRETDMSIAEISQAVGYDSQSKFTAVFKASFQVLPREYRKKRP